MNNIYEALGSKLKPIKADLEEIKTKLDAANNGIEDLRTRIEEIEKVLKEKKIKAT
jgi:peptidoglycan hydrolase CwlO-like protein